MEGITPEFVQAFRRRREDWDLWDYQSWVKEEERRLQAENPGLYEYITETLSGLSEKLDPSLHYLIWGRLYFLFLELIAIIREHEEIKRLEKLWDG